ncbi:hypothetical protein O181_034779 [Austropuccinia psidii MF-1]|uniref:Uncharacterized protein n=1 Tax=Austropuccinia psidii MF-1 TaxID=1389203 RepID=A0A9Q3D1E3_9BASI|nr:hypothetical protein [Austropuccinia psidii MF-1]
MGVLAFLGQSGPPQPLWPVDHNQGPQSVGQLDPFWPNQMRPKGAKGGSPLAPKPQLGPPEPNLATNHHGTKMAINHHRTHFGPGSPWTTFRPMAPGNHKRPPDQLSSIIFSHLKGNSSIPP